MPASYPTSVKTFTTLVDGEHDVLASHQNDRALEITAIETELGLTPKGTDATVKARLDRIDSIVREKLSAARTYYVRTDGSDSNTGLVDSAGGAFLTIQKAIDTVAELDANGKTVTIQVGNGTYTGAINLKNVIGVSSYTSLILQGDNTTPSNVVISTTSATCITATSLATPWQIKGFKLTTTTGGNCLYVVYNSVIVLANMEFGAAVAYHVYADYGGVVYLSASYTISGNGARHWFAGNGGAIRCTGVTITISGTPAFSGAFAYANLTGIIIGSTITFSGSATGTRYNVSSNAVINSGGGGATYFPGDGAGTSATGGQYL